MRLIHVVQARGLVPCGGPAEPACDFGQFIVLIDRVLTFAINNIALPLVVIFVVYGGFTILIAGGDPGKLQKGKKTIISAIVGLFIVLTSTLLIETVFRVLGGAGSISLLPWR